MDAVPTLTEMPPAQYVIVGDNVRLATYSWGDPEADPVLCVHGFGSSTRDNWVNTGWVRDLLRAGLRVIAVDQRGHGLSEKPHDAASYTMPTLVSDLIAVLDTSLVDQVRYLGYSLGGRVGWQLAVDAPEHVERAVLGGIPDGQPLTRFRVDDALEHLRTGAPVADRITRAYIEMAARTPTNDLAALVALVAGMQGGLQPDPARPPRQPVLFATGSEDAVLPRSQRLAAGTPNGEFFEIPGRNHFNAPTSRPFRGRALAFLDDPAG
jgi:pimeloyl-ACP methyl ester carboxylesterase